MKNLWLTLLYLTLLGVSQISFGQDRRTYNPEQQYKAMELQSDFIIMRWLLQKIHPNLYWYTPKAEYEARMDSLFGLLENPMTEREYYPICAKAIAQIRCGHTLIDPSFFYQDLGRRFPLDLKFIDDKAYILYNYSSSEVDVPLGAEVKSINGQSIPEITQQLFPMISADGRHKNGRYQALEDDFQNYYDLLIGQPDSFAIQYKYGEKEGLFYLPNEDSDMLRNYEKRYYMELAERKMLNFEVLNDPKKVGLLAIHSFMPIDIRFHRQKFSKFIRAAFSQIEQENIEHLIIDLRQNKGGDMLYVNELFSYLALEPYFLVDKIEVSSDKKIDLMHFFDISIKTVHSPRWVSRTDSGKYEIKSRYYSFLHEQKPQKKFNFKGKVYVLIGRRSYSASGLFACLASTENRAVFIGEETAASAKGVNGGDLLNFRLPSTGLQVQIPVEYWRKYAQQDDLSGGVKPDFEVKSSITDIVQAKDKVLEFTLELIRKQVRSDND